MAHRWAYRIFMTPIRIPIRPKEQAWLETAKQVTLHVRGLEIRAYEYGEGKPVFLVHGWMGKATQWHLMIDALLEKGYKTIAFDAKGHGNSPGKVSNILEFAGCLEALQAHYGVPVATIGHSLGAASIFLGMKHGFKTNSVVSIAQPVMAADIMQAFRLKINANIALDRALSNLVKRDYGAHFDEFATESTVKFAPDIPYQIIHDPADDEAYFSNGLWLKDQLKNVEFHELENVGHYKIVKEEAVISRVVDFVHRHDA
jgi:pimeloyl-ACP methyl ester carboxylesterase